MHVSLNAYKHVCYRVCMRIVAKANNKGGVGKTQITLGNASAARARGQRVLVVDVDGQGNSTSALLPEDYGDIEGGTAAILDGTSTIAQEVIASAWEGVDLLPATVHVTNFERETSPGAEFRLRRALREQVVVDTYDWVFIDCPPAVGRVTLAALVAADDVIIVTEPSKDATDGVINLLETIDVVREYYSPDLHIAGVALNKMQVQGKEVTYRAEELRKEMGEDMMLETIPLRSIIADSRGAGIPIHDMPGIRAATVASIFDGYLDRITNGATNND